ncbi:MAG: hypothetical protein WCW27_02505 [Patescibacteria group bacterium]|jgi:hypothetical protein
MKTERILWVEDHINIIPEWDDVFVVTNAEETLPFIRRMDWVIFRAVVLDIDLPDRGIQLKCELEALKQEAFRRKMPEAYATVPEIQEWWEDVKEGWCDHTPYGILLANKIPKNQRFVFYTHDFNHAATGILMLGALGLLPAEEVVDVITRHAAAARSVLIVSQSGRLIIGSKDEPANWQKVRELAIEFCNSE